MRDDVDRSSTSAFHRAVIANIPEGWLLTDSEYTDPTYKLTFECPDPSWIGDPTVTIEIKYGGERRKQKNPLLPSRIRRK